MRVATELELGELGLKGIEEHQPASQRVADRVEDVIVPPAVRSKLLVGADVNVVRVDGLGGCGGDPAELARPEGAHRQPAPPAIAGSSRTSSRSPTGVLSPSR